MQRNKMVCFLLGFKLNLLLTIANVCGDIYLHNPRGSNNRLHESSRARANGNNNFDSQNNDRGGYNVGSLFYYQGSILSIEWTDQHSCHNENNHCELILQYMCDDSIRDGVTTQTIPTNRAQCDGYNCNTDRRYRMHENYDYYAKCSIRRRNKGLFIADQNLKKRETARNTRQNPAGTRRGYECPEERDYYPYWHSSPWKDIVIMTNDVSRCHYYKQESQNVKSKWECVFDAATTEKIKGKVILPNNKEECEVFELPRNIESTVRKPTWREFPAHGIPAPDCRETEYTRDNHLGNGPSGNPNTYNWTIPKYVEGEHCVIRIRYNISTTDYETWSTDSTANADPNKLDQGSKVEMADKFGFPSEDAAKDRGYVFKNNPVLNVFAGLDLDLRLAINTAQFGRIFQDRTHTFAVRKAPDGIDAGAKIHNLNVRGKRGNIVQVYPSVEYDFHPNVLEMSVGDYVHVQWTGSNTNNRGNDGQGLAGTDRNNIALLAHQNYPEGNGRAYYGEGKFGHYGNNYPLHAENSTFLGWSMDDAYSLAFSDPGQFRGAMSELDDAGTYFHLPPRKVTKAGTYHYMCTRNNDFSNRDQKGRVVVNKFPFTTAGIGKMGGTVTLGNGIAKLSVPENVFGSFKNVRIERWTRAQGDAAMAAAHSSLSSGDDYASDFYVVSPENLMESETQQNAADKKLTFEMQLSDDGDDVRVYQANSQLTVWSKVEADIGGGMARVKMNRGGVFVARSHSNVGMIVGIVVACVVIVAIVGGTIFYFRRNPTKWQAVKTNCNTVKQSMQSKV